MNFKHALLPLFLLLTLFSSAQLFRISGVVMDNRKEPLPLASVEIKELRKGSVTKDNGSYEFFLERGKYDLVVSMVGFKTRVVTFYINNEDITENVVLEMEESASLSEVVIRAKPRDRAEELVRNVIKRKGIILDAIGSYSCNVYIKAFQLDSGVTKKKKIVEADSLSNEDYSGMSLTEVSLRLDKNSGGQVKEERVGVNKRGSTASVFYLSTTEGDFFIFNNIILSKI